MFRNIWKQLSDFIVRLNNFGYDNGELSTTKKEDIIICIPKEDKRRQFLKNWRPVTLLNNIYKTASALLYLD